MTFAELKEEYLKSQNKDSAMLDKLYALVQEKYPKKAEEVQNVLEYFGVAKWAFEQYEKDEIALLDTKRTSLFQILTMICKMADSELEPILLLTPNRVNTQKQISEQAKALLQDMEIFDENEQERFLLLQKQKEEKETGDMAEEMEEAKEIEEIEKKSDTSFQKPRLVILRKNAAILQSWKEALGQATKGEILPIFDLSESRSIEQLLKKSSINQALSEIKDGARKSLALHMSKGILDDFPIDPFPLIYLTQDGRLIDPFGLVW